MKTTRIPLAPRSRRRESVLLSRGYTKTKLLPLLLGCLVLAAGVSPAAQLGTGINYQGRLTDGGVPANGTYSFKYRLVADAAGTTPVGPVVDLPNQNVSGGLFNAQLDFGASAFNGQERWLEMSVKAGGPGAAQDYIKLNPQPLPPGGSSQFARVSGDVLDAAITGAKIAPLAVTSGNLADGAVTAAKLGAGSVSSSQIADGSITAADIASSQVLKSISINGTGNLRDTLNLVAGANVGLSPVGNTVTISAAGSGTTGLWTAPGGGSIYYNGGNVGIGTTQPQERLGVHGSISSTIDSDEGGSMNLRNLRKNGAASRAWLLYNMTGAYGDSLQMWNYPGSGSPGAPRFVIQDGGTTLLAPSGGNVGIGTQTPAYPLEVFSANNSAIVGKSAANGGVGVSGQSSAGGYGMYGLSSGNGVVGESSGAGSGLVGTSVSGRGVYGYSSTKGVVGESTGDGEGVFGKSATGVGVHGESTSTFAAVVGVNLAGGAGIYGESRGGGYAGNFAGKTRVCTLEIYGGCDLAEPFPMKEEQIEKGSVVVIDEEHPGRLKLSTHAYDTQVAGIVSGANGISPGISLKQEGALDQGHNVALTGRVYVKADASHGAIKPGDLLTTSDTPGHAMKVGDHTKSQGAILGKAMSALKDGTGLVLVLVTLQ